MAEFSGGCQCGAVRYRTSKGLENPHLCHYRMCQKASGNLFAALASLPKSQIYWTRGSPARWRSSANVDRGFCSKCGTPPFYDDICSDDIAITIGSLDQRVDVKPVSHDGIEGRMPWFADLNDSVDKGETETAVQAEWAAAIKSSNTSIPMSIPKSGQNSRQHRQRPKPRHIVWSPRTLEAYQYM
jgi:hypothetical protein